MKTITREFVEELINFAPTDEARRRGFAKYQLEGATALFNMLARNRVAYLADEVGMGKTYIALAILALLRWQKPDARVVVIAPRENIQRKWIKELRNFTRLNWRVVGNRVKSIQGGPARPPLACDSLLEFSREALLQPDRDFFLRMTSFSLRSAQADDRRRFRERLRAVAPWVDTPGLHSRDADLFIEGAGSALNALVPEADLVIVDEAHNLKHGLGARASVRNRVMARLFGHPEGADAALHWYGPRAKRLLLLSATPFEEDYADLYRQLDIFGFAGGKLIDGQGRDPRPVLELSKPDLPLARRRELVDRLMVRRVGGLQIGGRKHTKNMYRREWRAGGLQTHDEPLHVTDPRERLVVALMQKKVAEVLRDERFQNSFQVGMLSSFESFLETVATTARRRAAGADGSESEDASEGAFDGADQTSDRAEKEGVDSAALSTIVESHREKFGVGLPHPKLDATARRLSTSLGQGEKSLVFVRRVATVGELASRLERHFDQWLRKRIENVLPPSMHEELGRIWQRYELEQRSGTARADGALQAVVADEGDPTLPGLPDDEGSAETFFSWFFRGSGPRGVLSGAAFQKNRFSSQSSSYSTFFEDDHVAWLLGRPTNPLEALAKTTELTPGQLEGELRRRAWRHFRARTTRETGYPRILVFDSYQAAGLELIEQKGDRLAAEAAVILEEWRRERPGPAEEPPAGFPGPEVSIGATTFFTKLIDEGRLRTALWPDDGGGDFRQRFRRREQRRQLLSAIARLGLSYVDLYLLALHPLESFSPSPSRDLADPEGVLARDFVAELARQRREGTPLGAYAELAGAAQNFDLIVGVNFPDVPGAPLPALAEIYGRTLQRQVPVGRVSGGVNKRLVRQFRMPGFPLALITTNVLQEGEDLHTFCRNVVHYGITWTPSAMEQRNGRVDRIGSLAQRNLDGRSDEPEPEEFIQIYYPHLRETVEVLQVRRVLRRLNRFMELIHDDLGNRTETGSRIDMAAAILEELEDIAPIGGELRSAFPVRQEWLEGSSSSSGSDRSDPEAVGKHFGRLWEELCASLAIDASSRASGHFREAVARLTGGKLLERPARQEEQQHRFRVELRSHSGGDRTLVRCITDVGRFDVDDDGVAERLATLQARLGQPRLCATRDAGRQEEIVTLVSDLLFHPGTTQASELIWLVRRAVERAARLAHGMRDPSACLPVRVKPKPSGLRQRLDELKRQHRLPWHREEDRLRVELQGGAREQAVSIDQLQGAYRISSVVLGRTRVGKTTAKRAEAARRAWYRNDLGDLVSFGLDRGRLVGRIEQPIETLDDEELRLYVETVARESDRFEYALRGAKT